MIKLEGGPFDGKEVPDSNIDCTVYRSGKAIIAKYRDGKFEGYDIPDSEVKTNPKKKDEKEESSETKMVENPSSGADVSVMVDNTAFED